MNKRGSYGSMAERVARARGSAEAPSTGEPATGAPAASTASDPPAAPAPPALPLRHCWVTDGQGRLPGLLLEWRRRPDGWHARVVRPLEDGGGWVVVEEWLPAGMLRPVDS